MYEYYTHTVKNKQQYTSYQRKSCLIYVIPIAMYYGCYKVEYVSSFPSTCS